jgi:hypothetical protein
MDVRRSHRVSIQHLQQHTSRTICRQRVRCRLQAVEVIIAVGISPELPSQVVIRLILWVLEIVFPIRGRLPDVDNSIWNTLASCKVCNFAVHQGRVSTWGRVLDDASAGLPERGIRRPEGSQYRRRGRVSTIF